MAAMLCEGCNPAGPHPSLQKTSIKVSEPVGRGSRRGKESTWETHAWTELIDWGTDNPVTAPAEKDPGLLGSLKTFLERLQSRCRDECVFTLFAYKRKSVESLHWAGCQLQYIARRAGFCIIRTAGSGFYG